MTVCLVQVAAVCVLGAPVLAQRRLHRIERLLRRGRQIGDRELAPQHRRRLQHRAGVGRQPGQVLVQQPLEARRAGRAAQAQALDQVQRVPLAEAIPVLGLARASVAHPLRHRLGRRARQRQHFGLARQPGQERAHLGLVATLRLAVRGHHQQGLAAELVGQQQEQQQGWGIGRVQIVQHQHEWPVVRPGLQGAHRAIEGGEAGLLRPQCRHRSTRQVVAQAQRAEHLDPWPVSRCAARLPAAAPGHRGPLRRGLACDLLDQRRLADPRLAGEEEQAAQARARASRARSIASPGRKGASRGQGTANAGRAAAGHVASGQEGPGHGAPRHCSGFCPTRI
jgi:hypothetical protein